LRDELGIPRDALVVGAVGHLRPEKNLPRLLEAVAACARERDVHALLLGDGPEKAQLAELASRADLRGRVHFAGYQADPRAFYRAMDVFALSSDTEQMPIALLEALASSLPAISTDVGDVRAILPPGQASFVVPLGPTSAADYAGALSKLLGDAALRAGLGRANRERVAADFTLERMVASYRELYRSVARRS
jgi:glycosyltransferase involved in cell wall biosynthesis